MSAKIVKNYNLIEILKPYANKWVALSPDHKKVVSSGSTLSNTAKKIKRYRKDEVVFFKVLPFNASYAPTIL